MSRIDIENGKYTIINNNGILTILRYGEDWHYDSDKFTLCLAQTIEQQQEEIEKRKYAIIENCQLRNEIERLKEALNEIAYELCEGEWREVAIRYESIAHKALKG